MAPRRTALILVVPFVGPLLYFAFGRSTIPAELRLMLTAGGVPPTSSSSRWDFVFGG
jgi:hypothetical protein